MSTKRPTIRDVAREAGVHPTTASRALRNSPLLPVETRERIQRIAEAMQYRPHPLVNALMHLQRSSKELPDHLDLAYVNFRSPNAFAENIVRHAQDQATRLGCRLVYFDLFAGELSFERVLGICRSRNIPGIIWGPSHSVEVPEGMDWSTFALVSISTQRELPCAMRIRPDHGRNARIAWKTLRGRGFERIGMILSARMQQTTGLRWAGGYLAAQTEVPGARLIPPLILPRDPMTGRIQPEEARALEEWQREYQPQVILTHESYLQPLRKWNAAKSAKERTRWAGVFTLEHAEFLEESGIDQKSGDLGRSAVDALVNLLTLNQRGIGPGNRTLHLEGVWKDSGSTADARKSLKRSRIKRA